jgi:hypothetical protein
MQDIYSRPYAKIALLLLACLHSSTGNAAAFKTELGSTPLWGLADFELAYGVRWRTQDRDAGLISRGNGGDRSNGNGNMDDGNLNYDPGKPIANMFKASGELTLQWGNFGAFAQAYAFYDIENETRDRARTELSDEALDQVGKNADVLEAYLSARFEPESMQLQLRLGRQVVNWGESRFFPGDGINVANPLNLPLVQQPVGDAADLRLPIGMLWGSLQFSPILAVEAYYQYEWRATVLPATGTFFSGSDPISPGALNAVSGPFSDQGTNVDTAFGLPAGTIGFVPDWFITPRAGDAEPSDQGQFGISLRMLAPKLNDTAFTVHFANYHNKTPAFAATSPDTETYLEYSEQAIAAQRAELLNAGATPEAATAAASQIQFNRLLNDITYNTVYPENIRMLGLSFNTTSMRTGTALFGEVGYHFDAPMPVAINQLLDGALPGSVPSDPFPPVDLEQTSPAEIASTYANKQIEFFTTRDKIFVSLGATQLFGPKLGASVSALTAELGWLHIRGFPGKDELLVSAPGISVPQISPNSIFADGNSWGYRLAGSLTYNNVFGAFNLTPRFGFNHDVNGNSPSGTGNFREGSKSFNIGVAATYVDSLRFEIGYTTFWGAGEYNIRNDRDFFNFSARYNF